MKENSNGKLFAGISLAVSALMVFGAFTLVWLAPRDAAPAAAQDRQEQVKVSEITVRGSGTVNAKPDALVVNVGASMQADTVKEAQAQVSAVIDAMTAKIKEAGVEEKDYRTVQYNVEPVMDYGTGSEKGGAPLPKLIGFRVVNMMEVTFRDPAKAPEVLDELVSAGANTVYNVGYTFSNPDRLSNEAYDKAVKDAEARAARLAGLSQMELGKVVSVTEASANTYGPVFDKGTGYGGGAAGPFYPGQQSVTVDVIVTYEATAK